MTEEIRPICLYIETCLDKKEGTRDCAKCEHHLNYWTEVMIRDMEKNITRLEQENKELKKKLELDEVQLKSYFIGEEKICKENNTYRSALEEIRTYLNTLSIIDSDFPNTETYLRIENKIEEVIG